jgi:preprotein translocase subunit SecE
VASNFFSRIPTFVNQVRAETAKVTWPTRAETVRTGIMVVILTTFLGVFFFAVDSVFSRVVTFLLSLAA